jgi:arginine/lysine/ornithine decarboxylase
MAPVWEMLQEYIACAPARFHVPGHKGRGGFPLCWAADITELGFSDDLHRPSGVLREAQGLCAQAVGAAHSFFLVNGATAGIQAMLLLFAGGRVVLQRNCHSSVVSAAVMGDLELEFLPDGPLCPKMAGDMLDEHPGAPLFVTYPDYYGRCCDLRALAEAAQRRGRLLLVDASHGAHFPYSERLPLAPGAAGADLWVDSAHKTGLALTQGAYLHGAATMDSYLPRLQDNLSMVQTSSPSYLILASLDKGRERMQGYEGWASLVDGLGVLRDKLSAAGLGVELPAGYAAADPLRLTVDVSSRGMTGFEAARILQGRGVYVELADFSHVVAVCSLADRQEDWDALLEGLLTLPKRRGANAPIPTPAGTIPQRLMRIREAVWSAREIVPPKRCVGRLAACSAGSYPPGVPVIFPGEVYSGELVDYLIKMRDAGAELFGAFAVVEQ